MIDKPWHMPLLALLFAFATVPAHALQLIEARDGVTVEAVISIKDATRIRIENAAITDVFGNLYSSNCAAPAAAAAGAPALTPPATPPVNPGGDIALECDRDKGEIYVRPVDTSSTSSTSSTAAKPINLFVSSVNATYTLLLRRSDTPSDTIVLRDKAARRTGDDSSTMRQGPSGTSANHIRAMKALLLAMTSDRVAQEVRVEESKRSIQLWNDVSFSLIRTYEARGLVGEKYLLSNIGAQTMVLAEQEFDRPDAGVVGVAIDNFNLRPGESTSVYVIRRGN